MKNGITTIPLNETGAETFGAAELIFDNVFELFGTLDMEGHVVRLCGRIFEKTNTNPDLLVGQPFSQTVFWQSSENTSKLLEQHISKAAGGEPSRVIIDFRVSADEKIPVDMHFVPVEGPDGRQVFLCGKAASDRDQVAVYKRESEQLLLAAENAGIGLWFWDFSQERIRSTPQCNELLGLATYEPITFESFLQVVHPDDRTHVEELFREAQEDGSRYEEEFRVVYPDGSVEWMRVEGKSFLEDGKPGKMTGVVRKVTRQRLANEELEMVYDREKKARDEAVEANRAKDFFLAFVSHELRSPLNAILGWSKILLTKKVDDSTRQNALETIERSARFQTKLINDLVDSARVASGKLRLEYHPTNLYEIVKGSFEGQKPAAETHHLEYEFKSNSANVTVFGDAGRLQQVFGNLISNAIKFTSEGGKITVEMVAAEESVSVHVRDTGQGIEPDSLQHIFRQFSQGDTARKSSTGLGLGLSIVKILVTKHGGTVEAISEGPGKGAEFVVTLPLTNAPIPAARETLAPEASKRRPLRGVRILIVEDDSDSREVLQLFLEQSGATVTSADSARAAFAYMRASAAIPPSIIISDLAMPEEDGYSLIKRIRELPPTAGGNVPAMALSAFATLESKQKAFDSGFNRYSTKPFEPDLLVGDILDLVKKRA